MWSVNKSEILNKLKRTRRRTNPLYFELCLEQITYYLSYKFLVFYCLTTKLILDNIDSNFRRKCLNNHHCKQNECVDYNNAQKIIFIISCIFMTKRFTYNCLGLPLNYDFTYQCCQIIKVRTFLIPNGKYNLAWSR